MCKNRIVAIVQARMQSSRLPGKVLLELCGQPMLARVVCRVARATTVAQVVVAAPEGAEDEPIATLCGQLDVPCFRGNHNDVLDRFYRAADAFDASVVVRVTADCPLIDPQVIDRVVLAFCEHRPDYAANVLRRSWPRGLDTEVVAFDALGRAWREARLPYHRVHVMPYIYEHPERFRLYSVEGTCRLAHWRWTVDTAADLRFARAVYEHFSGDDRFTWHEVEQFVREHPHLAAINAQVRQKQLVEG